MKSKIHIRVMAFPVLMSLMLIACGGAGEPQASVPDPSSTLSAADHSRLGTEYSEQGDFGKALDEFEMAIELDPDDPEFHRNLGTLYLRQRMFEEAVTSYEKAIELNPGFGEAHGDLAGAYFSAGRIPEAIAAAEKGIELNPEYAMSYNNLAVTYGSLGDTEQAITLLEQAIQLNPYNDNAHYNLGYFYEILGQINEAIPRYQEAIRINPDYADAHQNLGFIYANLGQFDDAIYYWDKTLEIEPERAVTYKYLGMVYAGQNKVEEAVAAYTAYLELASIEAQDRAQVEGWITELEGATADTGSEYSYIANGYSLSYPAGWYHVEDGLKTSFTASIQDYESPTLESLLVTIIVAPLDQVTQGSGLDQNAAPAEFLQVMTERIEAEVEEIDSLQIAGYPAAIASTSGTVINSPYRGNMIIIVVEERLFLAEAIAPPDQWDASRPTFVDMINSLAFFEPL